LVEDFELSIQSDQWEKEEINNVVIKAVDFEALTPERMECAVETIKKNLDRGYKVYVHCKCGKGRSASVILCYLLKYRLSDGTQFNRIYKAHAYLKSRRPMISLNEAQLLSVDLFLDNIEEDDDEEDQPHAN